MYGVYVCDCSGCLECICVCMALTLSVSTSIAMLYSCSRMQRLLSDLNQFVKVDSDK